MLNVILKSGKEENGVLLPLLASPGAMFVCHDVEDLVAEFAGDDVVASPGRRDQVITQLLLLLTIDHRLRAKRLKWTIGISGLCMK